MKDDISYVAENGSMCVHDGKIVSLGHIDTGLIYEIADAAKEYGHCHTLISTARTGYTDSKDSDYIDHIRNDVGYDMDVVQNVRDIKEPLSKSQYVILMEPKNVFAPIFKNVSVIESRL